MNEWHLYEVTKANDKFVLKSPKRSLEISGRIIFEKDGLQLIQITSAVDLPSGKAIHIYPNEVIFFHPKRNLASFDKGKLQQAVAN